MSPRSLVPALVCVLTLVACGTPRAERMDAVTSPSQAAASPTAVVALPTGRAPSVSFPVATRTLNLTHAGRALKTTVYYPKTRGTYPVVVFGHGLGGLPEAYRDLLRRWAAAGFVVAAPLFPNTSRGAASFNPLDVINQPADLGAVLDGLLALDAADPVRERLDSHRVAAAGHSAGAISALGVFTAEGAEGRDERFTAGVILAGNSIGVGETFTGPAVPMLFVHADADPVVPVWSGRSAYQAIPWPKAFLSLPGKEHTAPYIAPANPRFALVAAATLDFLRWSLYGDAAAGRRLARRPGLDDQLGI